MLLKFIFKHVFKVKINFEMPAINHEIGTDCVQNSKDTGQFSSFVHFSQTTFFVVELDKLFEQYFLSKLCLYDGF